ncbi:protein of unknown function [Paraburkholderia kururiensis]
MLVGSRRLGPSRPSAMNQWQVVKRLSDDFESQPML